MVISSFYNKVDKILFLSTTIDAKKVTTKTSGEVTKIYNEKEELIGVNISSYTKELEQGIVNNGDIMEDIKLYFGDNILSPYIVGEIESIEKHPKSDKLNICQVNLGEYKEQIVCGASNVKEGIRVIVSQVGAVMPNGMAIKKSKLIDVKSNGMITSYSELGLEEETGKGIAILDDSYVVGNEFKR